MSLSNNEMIYKDLTKKTTSKAVITSCMELIYKFTGLYPYKEQKQAALALYKGDIVDMKTGEGKTLACLLALLLAVRDGHKVYIVTSNDYLSERDYNYSKELLKSLDIKSVFLKNNIGGSNETYKNNDVIYATGETLIFDYLRGIRADYDFVIIDEIDHILVESANHDFSVSTRTSDTVMPISIFKMCQKVAEFLTTVDRTDKHKKEEYLFDLQCQADLILNHPGKTVEITDLGYSKLRSLWGDKTNDPLYIEILLATLHAKYFFLKDKDYAVHGDKLYIISDSNGRIEIGGHTDICIQTAIELNENVPLSAKALLANTCSFAVFFSIFKTLTGISGTTSYVPYDFDVIYSKNVVKIKEHFPNQRKEIFEYFKTDDERLQYISSIIKQTTSPVLLVADCDARANFLKEFIENIEDKNVFVLNNDTLYKEVQLLEDVKNENAVLISSKIVGRGTDIDLPKSFEEGLTVILAQRLFSERAERQIIGRTGRNGKKGTAYILTSFDDKLFDLEYKDKKNPTEKYVKALQDRYEQRMFDSRKHIYIRSKFFFDQDNAIKEKLKEFKSYEEILSLAKKQRFENEEAERVRLAAIKLLNMAIRRGYMFLPAHNAILLKCYESIRPYYQQQFLHYNDTMATTLYNNETFHDRCKEYVETGKSVIFEVVIRMLTVISEDQNGRS